MSFINIRNNRGPKIDPGYSTITYNYANTFPFNTTLCYLALITRLVQFKMLLEIPCSLVYCCYG